jgi:hypothetical protein
MSCSNIDNTEINTQTRIFPYDEPKVTGPVKPWRTILNTVNINDCDLKGSDAFTICTSYFDLYDKNCEQKINNCCQTKCKQSSKNPEECIENCKNYSQNFCQYTNDNFCCEKLCKDIKDPLQKNICFQQCTDYPQQFCQKNIENYTPIINTETLYNGKINFGMPSGYDKYSVCVELPDLLGNNCYNKITNCCQSYCANDNKCLEECKNFANSHCKDAPKQIENFTLNTNQKSEEKSKHTITYIILIVILILILVFGILSYIHIHSKNK